MAISTYHQLAGSQARGTGSGRQGLRYDVPVGTFQTKSAMPAQEDFAEPVAQATVEESITPIDTIVDQALSDIGDAQQEPQGYTPDYADPVSSGDPTSDPSFGATEIGDRAKSQPQAAAETFAEEVGAKVGRKGLTNVGLNIAGVPAALNPAPATPAAAVGLVAQPAYKALKAYQQYEPPPNWKKTMTSELGDSGVSPDMGFDAGPRDMASVLGLTPREIPYEVGYVGGSKSPTGMTAQGGFKGLGIGNPSSYGGSNSPGRGAHGGMAGEADVSGLSAAEAKGGDSGRGGGTAGRGGGTGEDSGDSGAGLGGGHGGDADTEGAGW